MNIYLIQEDGESFCIRAKSMGEAVTICLNSYLEDLEEEKKDKFNKEVETKYYHEDILQSCHIVGVLKNYPNKLRKRVECGRYNTKTYET